MIIDEGNHLFDCLDEGPMKKRRTTNFDCTKQDHLRMEELVPVRPDGLAICSKGATTTVNSALARMLNCTIGSLVGRDLISLFSPQVRETTQHKFDVLLQDDLGHTTSFRSQLIRADRTVIDVDASICRLDSEASDHVVTFRPQATFSDGKSASNQAVLQRTHMLQMSVFGELAAALVHSLGQPVTAATGAKDLLLDANGQFYLNKGNERAVAILLESVDDLAARFKKIWDFVRVRKPSLETVGINSICEDAIDLVRESARHAGVAIDFSAGRGLTATVDPSLVQLALVSLLHRSVLALTSATESNRSVSVSTSGEGCSYLCIKISHDGFGLSGEEQFDSTLGVEVSVKENLTLDTCRLIAEEHGGILWVTPEVDRLTYRLILPA